MRGYLSILLSMWKPALQLPITKTQKTTLSTWARSLTAT